MKKKLVTIAFIALILTLSLSLLSGCFFQNLSIISGKMSEEALDALEILGGNGEAEEEDETAEMKFANFTQINSVTAGMGAESIEITNIYKLTETGFYWKSSSVTNGVASTSEYYVEKDGDYYFAYVKDPTGDQWKVGSINKDYYTNLAAGRTSGVSADTRINLYNYKNYKSAGKKYKYTGPEVYIEMNDMKMVLDVDGLYIIDAGVEIKCNAHPEMTAEQKDAAAAAGYNLFWPVSYKVVNIGTTSITYPHVINPEYKESVKNRE